MQSIKTIYKIGPGPSSSHTFGPMMASKYINEQYPEATNFKITLFGSLALTGKRAPYRQNHTKNVRH